MKQLLTNSRLKAYRLCPRLHWLSYVEGWKPAVEAPPLAFGTAFHHGMEAYWSRGERRPPVQLEDPFEQARVEAMLAGYEARWADDFDRYETVAIEEQFETPLEHPVTGEVSDFWILAGKIDLLLRDRSDGAIVLDDHKTTGEDVSIGAVYWQRLRLDTQITQYYVGARALGHDVKRTLYDVAVKPKMDPYRATPHEKRKYTKAGVLYANQREVDETPDEFRVRVMEKIASDPAAFYARGEIVRTESEIANGLIDTWDYAARIRQDMETGWAPRNPDACHKYGRPCPFYSHCTGDMRLDCGDFVKSGDVNPELTKEAA